MGMMFRAFDKHIEDRAAECHAATFTDEPFEITGGQEGGGTGAVPVKMLTSGLPAFAKPTGKGNQNLAHAAHEKIAADLGYELGLPVAPVVLSKNTAGMDVHSTVAVSYPALVAGKPWAGAPMDPQLRAQLRAVWSATYPFLAWIDDHDHFGGANTHYEIVGGGPRLSLFDFSYSMTQGWPMPGPAPIRDSWANRAPPYDDPDPAAVGEILQRIEGFPVKDLERIITATPSDCLSPETQGHLLVALDHRRADLRRLLNY